VDTGETKKVDEPPRLHIAKGILLQDPELAAKLQQLPATRVRDVVEQLVRIGDAVLRIVALIAPTASIRER
jgi:hypothetical protein